MHPESTELTDYLKPCTYIDFQDIAIQQKADELCGSLSDEHEKIKAVFEFVRDDIFHSADIDSERVTRSASEVLQYREGICFAKSHLFAALLRYIGIPVGLCYQRLTKDTTPDAGYVLHGLNAVYLSDENRWVRLDARGNNAQVHTPFSLTEERLPWPARKELGETDYHIIYSSPPLRIVQAFEAYHNRKSDEFGITEL